MSTPSRLLWAERQFPRPQHFRQPHREHQARLHQRASALHPYDWGVRNVVRAPDALRHHTLRVQENRAAACDAMPKAQAISIDVPTGIADLKRKLIAISP